MFECKRCGYIAGSKGNYKLHIYKSRTCEAYASFTPIESIRSQYEADNAKAADIVCKHCHKCFASSRSRSNHLHRCKMKKQGEDRLNNDELLVMKREDLDGLLLQRFEQILSNMGMHTVQQNSNQINNRCNVTNVTVNFNIRDFDDESGLDTHIGIDFKLKCLLEKNIPKLIKEVFCNGARPENQCVRLKNQKKKLFEVVRDGKWVNQEGDETLKDLIDKGYRILRHLWLWETKDMVDNMLKENDCYREVKSWFDRVCEDDPKLYKEMKDRTFLIFVDHKEGHLALLSR